MTGYECNIPTWILNGSIQRLKLQLSRLLKSKKKGTDLFFPFFIENFLWSAGKNRSVPFFLPGGGARRDRTADLLLAKQVLSQLSYGPVSLRSVGTRVVGLGGFEPPASPLSGVRSNQLSYRPRGSGCFLSPGNLCGYSRKRSLNAFAL